MKSTRSQINYGHLDHVVTLGWSARTYARHGFDHLDHLDQPFKLNSTKGQKKILKAAYIETIEICSKKAVKVVAKPPSFVQYGFKPTTPHGQNSRHTWSYWPELPTLGNLHQNSHVIGAYTQLYEFI